MTDTEKLIAFLQTKFLSSVHYSAFRKYVRYFLFEAHLFAQQAYRHSNYCVGKQNEITSNEFLDTVIVF